MTLKQHFFCHSISVGVAGNFIGRLQSELPELWPETLRALTIDSASWTESVMKKLYGKNSKGNPVSKTDRENIIREHGFGIPNLNRAIRSVNNDTTLISQTEIQPFRKKGYGCKYNEFHFYKLPWPKNLFLNKPEIPIKMKVTLSYFIEPDLTALSRPESYRSFGLKFALKKKIRIT